MTETAVLMICKNASCDCLSLLSPASLIVGTICQQGNVGTPFAGSQAEASMKRPALGVHHAADEAIR